MAAYALAEALGYIYDDDHDMVENSLDSFAKIVKKEMFDAVNVYPVSFRPHLLEQLSLYITINIVFFGQSLNHSPLVLRI
jgi:hypothetical protein